MARFKHYLSYGSTDQQTARDLTGYFDGLIVPGTVAAFQAEGTKGFVLSLSARSSEPYAIDPRFPLFQGEPASWKKSHLLLAQIFGFDDLLGSGPLRPAQFDDALVDRVARGWIDFNVDFEDVRVKTFDKYASRLPEDNISLEDRKSPDWILPPYLMPSTSADPWRAVGERLWSASVAVLEGSPAQSKLRRVVAAESVELWDELLRTASETEVVGWVSRLDELSLGPEPTDELARYGMAIRSAAERGQTIFALYGGFFSVILGRYGLLGSSHGVGYGEHRDHVELPSSGAPPARYYVPRLHRYVGVDVAATLWSEAPELVACGCVECSGRSPASLDYHELMRHSVRARKSEIESWTLMTTEDVIATLLADFKDFQRTIDDLVIPRGIRRRAEGVYQHLMKWVQVLERIEAV